MTAAPLDRIRDAIAWIEQRKLVRVYTAPELLTPGQTWSLRVWAAIHGFMTAAADLGSSGRIDSCDEPGAIGHALAVADAIVGGEQ